MALVDRGDMSVNVLIIEDDVDLNDLVLSHLTLDKFVCRQAFSGEEGLTLARNLHPDVVVLDIMMPGIDGYEVCRKLKASRSTCDIPILILSCMCRVEHAGEGWRAGAWAQMGKPFEPRNVARQVEEAARWRQQTIHRPPNGEFIIDAKNLQTAARGLAEMLCVLVSRTAADDAAVGQIRDAFVTLEATEAANSVRVIYSIEPASPLSGENPTGGALRCTLLPIAAAEPGVPYAKAPSSAQLDAAAATRETNWVTEFMATSAMRRLDPLPEQRPEFFAADIRLERRFPAGGMISPLDGNVLPITTSVKTNTPNRA